MKLPSTPIHPIFGNPPSHLCPFFYLLPPSPLFSPLATTMAAAATARAARHGGFRRTLPISAFLTLSITSYLLLHSLITDHSSAIPELRAHLFPGHVRRGGSTQMHGRLLRLASSSLSQCLSLECGEGGQRGHNNGYIAVSANGGLSQQRVAVCNGVAVASLLNATLLVPRFLYSNVWKDPSQFGDIYQEDHFVRTLKEDITVVRELPPDLKSLNMKEIGSLITDADLLKEAKPREYVEKILPILLKNQVVHFLGFGNRLGFDPLPSYLQGLRCKCNFHALKFTTKIQEAGSLLVKRIRRHGEAVNTIERRLFGRFLTGLPSPYIERNRPLRYLALHLRFEVDMVAYSWCDFGGGEKEREELRLYRKEHFPLLLKRLRNSRPLHSAEELRKLGKCPLTPEEAGLVLSGLGLSSQTRIYLASSDIYGGESRMEAFTHLYPNVIKKEDILTATELTPFKNFSSQLAALDFIVCAAADVFAMTDSGSQLSSLVSGFRTYYTGGSFPTIKPNKKRLAKILAEHNTMTWLKFEERVTKMVKEGQMVHMRGFNQSVYKEPRCLGCMCQSKSLNLN